MFIRTKQKKGKDGRVWTYYELCTNVRAKGGGSGPKLIFIKHLGKRLPSEEELKKVYQAWSDARKDKAKVMALKRLAVQKRYSKDKPFKDEAERLRWRREDVKATLLAAGFKSYREGMLDPSKRIFLSLRTGEVLERKTKRLTSAVAHVDDPPVLFDTYSLKERLGLIEAHSQLVKSRERALKQAVSVEEFRKQYGF